MKKGIVLLLLLGMQMLLWGQYQLTSNNKVYYKSSEQGEEKIIRTNDYFPNGDVFVRMHSSSSADETFTIKDLAENREYVCKAPMTWPGKMLKECILMPVQQRTQRDTRRTAIARGDSESRHAPDACVGARYCGTYHKELS